MNLEQARFQVQLLKQAGYHDYYNKVDELVVQFGPVALAVAEQADQLISTINDLLPIGERVTCPKPFVRGVREMLRFAEISC